MALTRRQTFAYGAVAAAAAAAGAGMGVWRQPSAAELGAAALPPDFWTMSFTRPEGGDLALAAFRGKPLIINFWATWCAPCKEEMPTLQTLAELEGERLAVLAVNVREPLPRVRRYAQSAGLTFPILPDPRGDITRAWGMTVFPTTALIDTAGRPQRVVSGAVDWTGATAQDWVAALRR